MAQVNIDLSLLTETAAYARVYGTIRVREVPHVGDVISFPLAGGALPEPITVTDRILTANADEPMLIALSDVRSQDMKEAAKVAALFQQHYQLFVDIYEEDGQN